MKNLQSTSKIIIASLSIFTLASCGVTKPATSTSVYPDLPYLANLKTLKIKPLTDTQLQRWSHLDLQKDTIPGMSVDKAYAQLLAGKKGVKVIVGVVDSGVDIDHEDLKSVIWKNTKEIPNNKIDDDKNGYIDDIHGWNFLGNAENETLEMTRIVKKADDGSAMYSAAKAEYDAKYAGVSQQKQQVDFIVENNKAIQTFLKKEKYTQADLDKIVTKDPNLQKSKAVMGQMIAQAGPTFLAEIEDYRKQVYDQIDYNLNKNFDGRKIVGDNPEDITDTKYGTNIVYAPHKDESLHGTHVAGIIAQVRNNKKGGDGVSNNVAIMSIRAVPNGDEYDKDIALAIRYAVDNGAKVINGSFGKSYSPHKQWVYDAIKYAETKDVLIVFAAGNEAENTDLEGRYPNDTPDNINEVSDNVLKVGAINYEYGANIVAGFSNFGNKNVDVFAPGEKIYSSTPNNTYSYLDGTSMASPNVAGVAALIRSYYPSLTCTQVKHIIIDSTSKIEIMVNFGKNKEKSSFQNLSKSGGIVNAYEALKLAENKLKKSGKN
jgi:cell wall-associated protease